MSYQAQAVCLWVGLGILRDIPVGHPLGQNAETALDCIHRHSQQRQDVFMGQVLPSDGLSTQRLGE